MDIQVISNEEFEKYLCASHIPKKLFMAFNNGWYRGLDNFYSNDCGDLNKITYVNKNLDLLES